MTREAAVRRAAGTTRNVSSRELSRRTSHLLDEIESHGSALVVIRYGRPSAVLVPFEDVAARPVLPRLSDLGGELTLWPLSDDNDEDLDDIELDEHQRRVLVEVDRCTLLHWTPSQSDLQAGELAIALAGLEISGLLERGPGASWRLTRRGERVVRGLDSET
jgi:antitoxin (DNA-binding transcriptional repressor) of toxin-antitoxin stability system